jgi:hypothetical protein
LAPAPSADFVGSQDRDELQLGVAISLRFNSSHDARSFGFGENIGHNKQSEGKHSRVRCPWQFLFRGEQKKEGDKGRLREGFGIWPILWADPSCMPGAFAFEDDDELLRKGRMGRI